MTTGGLWKSSKTSCGDEIKLATAKSLGSKVSCEVNVAVGYGEDFEHVSVLFDEVTTEGTVS